jgi:hypothetical protein
MRSRLFTVLPARRASSRLVNEKTTTRTGELKRYEK